MNRQKKDGAISEVLGTLLLLGLAVGLFSVLYIIVFSYPFSPNPPSADLIGSIAEEGNTMTVTIENLGGSTLSLDTKIIISSGDVLKSLRAKDFAGIDINGDGYWGMGETFNYPWSDVIAGDVYVTVIDQASNSIVMSGVLPAPFIATVVNPIIPSLRTTTPLNVAARATGDSTPDDVSLWYRFGSTWTDDFINKGNVSTYHTMTFTNGNVTVNQTNNNIVDYVDNDQSNVDGSTGLGTHSNFNDEKNKDGNYDILSEGYQDHKTAVQSSSTNVDGSPDKGTETTFANCQDTARDNDYMTIREVNQYSGTSTLGKTTGSGSSYTTISADRMYGQVFTATSTGEIYQATFYGRSDSSSTRHAKIVICDATGHILTNGESNEISVSSSSGNKVGTWSAGVRPAVASGQTYWIMVIAENSIRLYYDSTSGGISRTDTSNSYTNPTDPTDASSGTTNYRVLYADMNNMNYQIDLEYNWTNANFNGTTKELCMYFGSHTGSESLSINYRNGATWTSLGTVDGTGWKNVTALGLSSRYYTIQLKGTTETSDTLQDSWTIDCMFLRCLTMNYSMDLEVQWTSVDPSQKNELLCLNMQSSTAYSLDATGGYMSIGGGTPDWGSAQGTISFWIKWGSSINGRVWGQNDFMEIRTSGSHLALDWDSSSSLTSTTSFITDKWYFIAIAWDENTNDLYLYVGDQNNPPAEDTHLVWSGSVTNRNPDHSGQYQGNTFMASRGQNAVNGHGDDLRYWDTDRSLANLQSDYTFELTGSETNLRSYYKLNNNFDDTGPNNNDGSGSGSYSFSSDIPFSVSPTENMRVDVWNTTTSTWNNLFAYLVNGWNNASVHTWLTQSTFTIRYTDSPLASDTHQDRWMIDAALLHLTSAYYQGDLTSITITKPSSSTWTTFNAEVNNTANSTFRILDQTGTPLLSNLNGDNNNISSISANTIRLFGSFDGPVKLDSWSVSNGNAWIQYGTDTQSSDGWSWSFTFPFGKGTYWFYSIGRKIHFSDESPPVNPSYDTSCIYWP